MEQLHINGETVGPHNLQDWRQGKGGILADIAAFLDEWYAPAESMLLHTSGSTGTPKAMQACKAAMRASATATCRFFGLRPGHRALLCLPMRYIAGKMMVVRALVGRLELVVAAEPGSTPFAALREPVDFAPIVPMQALTTLQQANAYTQLNKAGTILLGGGFVDPALEEALQTCKAHVYASYGMTETLSHIALRRINGPTRTDAYSPLPGVELSLSPAGTLQISAPFLGIEHLTTNDLAEISAEGNLRILGRADSVINSGGIKIQAEELEQELTAATGLQVLVVPIPHPVLGQAIGLLWEGPATKAAPLQQALAALPKYHRPQKIQHGTLPRTATGKPNRLAAVQLLQYATQ